MGATSGRTYTLQFLLGGVLVNCGYRMQDHLGSYDFESKEEITPEEIWKEMSKQNALAASVRTAFPRTAQHPLVAIASRLESGELAVEIADIDTATDRLVPAESYGG